MCQNIVKIHCLPVLKELMTFFKTVPNLKLTAQEAA